MEEATFSVPSLWADHHVLAVRELLTAISGVHEVRASALNQDVQVKYDPAIVNPDSLAQSLSRSGYAPGKHLDPPAIVKGIDDSSDWFKFQERITVTDRRDLEASGDHRKY
jgi:copper chaperone CopZ